MINIIRRNIALFQAWGLVVLNKGSTHNNFIYLLVLMTVWLLNFTLVVNKRRNGLTFLFVVLTSLVILAIKTKSVLLFYAFFEIRILPITLILYLYGYQPEKLQASLFLLLYTVIRSLPLFFFIITCTFGIVSSALISLPITLAFLVKTPMYLLHTWLPKAHVEAPVGGSIFLAGVLLKLGSYGLLLFLPIIKLNWAISCYFRLGLLGSIIRSLISARQGDMKLLIAYSSIVHIGVVTIGFVRGTELGYTCGIMIVLAHGLCSPFLFALAYWLYLNRHSRLILNNSSTWPMMSILFFALISLNIGVPPSLNVWSEVYFSIATICFMSEAWVLLLLIFLLRVVYNLYLYTSSMHSKFNYAPKNAEINSLFPTIQTIFYGYCSFFCLELFHLSLLFSF